MKLQRKVKLKLISSIDFTSTTGFLNAKLALRVNIIIEGVLYPKKKKRERKNRKKNAREKIEKKTREKKCPHIIIIIII